MCTSTLVAKENLLPVYYCRMRTVFSGAIALAAATLILVASASAANPNPKQMVLRLQDLPTGFQSAGHHYKSLSAAANGNRFSEAQYRAWGYVIGYEADFSQNGSLADLFSGATEITSTASVYRTSAGAEKSLASSAKACSQSPSTELSVGVKIGNEVHLCSIVRKSKGVTVQVYGVMWRRGRVKAAVLLGGPKGSVSPKQAVTLAKRQDGRIRQRL
jgi:hypothetical protein